MTRDEVKTMPAGEQMDQLIAALYKLDPAEFSTRIDAAWLVIKKVQSTNDIHLSYTDELWHAIIWEGMEALMDGTAASASANTAPLAVCRAALLMLHKT